MVDCASPTNFQPQGYMNTVTHPHLSSNMLSVLQMPIRPTRNHPISLDLDVPYNNLLPYAGTNNSLPHVSNNQNTITEQAAFNHRPSIRKRAPKAQIMTREWSPAAEARIRELYVTQGKQVKDVRKIINEEFGFKATEIQYKNKIKEMKIQRRGNAREREAIVLHTLYRKKALKKESYVRLRGHQITQEKLMRWMKEVRNPLEFTVPPPSLSSGISVCSISHPGSPRLTSPMLSPAEFTDACSMSNDDAFANLVKELKGLRTNAQAPERVINYREAGAVFNEVQKILSSEPNIDLAYLDDTSITGQKEYKYTRSSPTVAQDILQVRNRMNMDQQLVIKEEYNCTDLPLPEFPSQQSQLIISRFNDRYVSWKTESGLRIDASIHDVLAIPESNSNKEVTEAAEVRTNTTVAILSSATKKPSYRVAFSFRSALPITVTFQATIPNTSEVFRIVSEGNVEMLRKALQLRTAHLTDRDEEGRSLLNYALAAVQPEMTKFLLDNKADPNAMERCKGSIYTLHAGLWLNYDNQGDDDLLIRKARIAMLLAVYGADASIDTYVRQGFWVASGLIILQEASLVHFQSVIYYSAPFIHPNILLRFCDMEIPFLCYLIIICQPCNGADIPVELVDKAIFLLHQGADVNYRREDTGDTLLHLTSRCLRMSTPSDPLLYPEELLYATKAPLELLVMLIAAGADIYARNDYGETLTDIAWKSGREKDLHRALTVCGIDTDEYYDFTCPECRKISPNPPSSKLTFEAFCDRRDRGSLFDDLPLDEDERRWLGGDYINVPFRYEWLDREYHNPHGPCIERLYRSPYSSDGDCSEGSDFDEGSSEEVDDD